MSSSVVLVRLYVIYLDVLLGDFVTFRTPNASLSAINIIFGSRGTGTHCAASFGGLLDGEETGTDARYERMVSYRTPLTLTPYDPLCQTFRACIAPTRRTTQNQGRLCMHLRFGSTQAVPKLYAMSSAGILAMVQDAS